MIKDYFANEFENDIHFNVNININDGLKQNWLFEFNDWNRSIDLIIYL